MPEQHHSGADKQPIRLVLNNGDVRFRVSQPRSQTFALSLAWVGLVLVLSWDGSPWWVVVLLALIVGAGMVFALHSTYQAGVYFVGDSVIARNARSRSFAVAAVQQFDVRPGGNSPARGNMVLTDGRVIPLDGVSVVRATRADTRRRVYDAVDLMNAELLSRKQSGAQKAVSAG
jgi:hypothetical protein